MAQTDAFPMASDATLADSRTTINDIVAALKSCYSGTSAPTSPSPVAGQYFFNTTTSVLSVYDGTAWRVIGTFTADYGGLLPRSAGSGQALSGALYCGSQQVKGMANASASTDAVAYGQADARYLQKAGDTMTGNLAMGANFVSSSSTPTADSHLTRKAYVDTKAVAGGTFTGAVNMNSNAITNLPAPSAAHHAARQAEITDLLDTSTGHRHDGTDARRVLATDMSTTGLTAGRPIGSAGGSQVASFAMMAYDTDASYEPTSSYVEVCSATINVPHTDRRVLARFSTTIGPSTEYITAQIRVKLVVGAVDQKEWVGVGCDTTPSGNSISVPCLEYVLTPASTGNFTVSAQVRRESTPGGHLITGSVFTLTLI